MHSSTPSPAWKRNPLNGTSNSWMHKRYFLNLVLLPKKGSVVLFVLLFISSTNLTVSPSNLVSELCKHGGMQKLYHVQIPSCPHRGQNKCPAPPVWWWSEGCKVYTVILACQLNIEKITSLKLIVPRFIVCHEAKWMRNTPQIEVCKSLNGALNSHQSCAGSAVNSGHWLNQYNKLSCWFPDHMGGNGSAVTWRVKKMRE